MHPDYIYYHHTFAGDNVKNAEFPPSAEDAGPLEAPDKGEEEKHVETREEYVAKHETQMLKRKFNLKKDMLNMMTQTVAIFIFQGSFCYMILQASVIDKLKEEVETPELTIAFARFITGIALHVQMTTDMVMGMNKMKFAINHKWKFARWRYAYLAGLGQVVITLGVAVLSYFVIVFSGTVIEIVKDFLALQVISQLDDYFFIEYVRSREICK